MFWTWQQRNDEKTVKWMFVTIRPGWNSSFLSAGRFLNKALYIFWPIVKVYINTCISYYHRDKPQSLNCYPISDQTIMIFHNILQHILINFGRQTNARQNIFRYELWCKIYFRPKFNKFLFSRIYIDLFLYYYYMALQD